MRELGQAEYQELSKLADKSAAIKDTVINHGMKRGNRCSHWLGSLHGLEPSIKIDRVDRRDGKYR